MGDKMRAHPKTIWENQYAPFYFVGLGIKFKLSDFENKLLTAFFFYYCNLLKYIPNTVSPSSPPPSPKPQFPSLSLRSTLPLFPIRKEKASQEYQPKSGIASYSRINHILSYQDWKKKQ